MCVGGGWGWWHGVSSYPQCTVAHLYGRARGGCGASVGDARGVPHSFGMQSSGLHGAWAALHVWLLSFASLACGLQGPLARQVPGRQPGQCLQSAGRRQRRLDTLVCLHPASSGGVLQRCCTLGKTQVWACSGTPPSPPPRSPLSIVHVLPYLPSSFCTLRTTSPQVSVMIPYRCL